MKRASSLSLMFLLTTLVLDASVSYAKSPGLVMGRVSAKDGSGVLGAVITIFKQDHDGGTISFTRSDKNGFYRLNDLTPGSYYLQVSREGFQPLTSSDVKVVAGRSTVLNVILQEFINLMSDDKNPRNLDLKSILRSTSDRRLIFRDLPGTSRTGQRETDTPFFRSGTINIASSAGLGNENYSVYPNNGENSVASNFAFTEPVSEHGRMIFSGQLSSGFDSYWRVRNTFQYRPEPDRDMKLSVGYGRMSMSGSSVIDATRPMQFLSQDPSYRDGGVQTLMLGFEGRNKVMDSLAVEYGFDLSRIYYGQVKSAFSPYLQLVITPVNGWVIRSAMQSRRLSDANGIMLPDGELLNLMEPTYITKNEGDISISQFKHSELAVAKDLPDEASVELAVYEDHMVGAGTPFLVSTTSEDGPQVRMAQLAQNQTGEHGMRVTVSKKMLDYVTGSVAYVYGTGASFAPADTTMPADLLARDLLSFVHRSYYHSLKGEVRARLPRTNTSIAAALRWYPGYSLTPIDLFADKMDLMTKGVNFSIRQPIHFPDFLGSVGRWEALVDVRNLFDQGTDTFHTGTGDFCLIRNPRSLRFGINLNLY